MRKVQIAQHWAWHAVGILTEEWDILCILPPNPVGISQGSLNNSSTHLSHTCYLNIYCVQGTAYQDTQPRGHSASPMPPANNERFESPPLPQAER